MNVSFICKFCFKYYSVLFLVPTWLTVVIAILIILITLVVGIVVGIIVATRWGRLVDALAGSEFLIHMCVCMWEGGGVECSMHL